jgi:hypothetical protein
MAQTTNYNIVKPDVGASENTWGTTLNTATDLIDSTIKTVSDAIPTSIVASSITNTPNSLGTAKQVLRMNSGANATEFATPSITDMSDTPAALGTANQILKMNAGATALEWATDSSGTSGISNIVEDTTPQLGGALDCQNNNLTNVGTLNASGLALPSGGGTLAKTAQIPAIYRVSTAVTLVAQQVDTYTHSLGGKPDGVQFILVCVTGEHGYSTNDEIYYLDTSSDASYSPSVFCENTTQVKVQHGYYGRFQIAHKTSGLAVTTTLANWKYKLNVWRFN